MPSNENCAGKCDVVARGLTVSSLVSSCAIDSSAISAQTTSRDKKVRVNAATGWKKKEQKEKGRERERERERKMDE